MLTLNNNNGQTHGLTGVFIKEARIVSATDLSGKPSYQDNPESIRDLAVEIEFDIGQDWNKKVVFKGDLKQDGNFINWHSAFIVKELFIQTGCFNNLTEEEIQDRLQTFTQKQIPVDFLSKIRGRSIFSLDYIRGINEEGKPRYSSWNIVKKDEHALAEAFRISIAKGYPSNYKPELINNPEKAESFEYGANTEQNRVALTGTEVRDFDF
ncbi:MAG: hypothetical protein PF445_09835 [Melioribacteraceae bacterium]|jgi:hypothetical protein|nr:hypothetical protein [Melioribacteraceae bacterium]